MILPRRDDSFSRSAWSYRKLGKVHDQVTMAATTSAHRPVQIYTEERAVYLVTVFVAVVSVMLLLGWQDLIILKPLKRGEVEMEHMDPSVIAATPFPLQNVASFTMLPVVVNLIYIFARSPMKLTSHIISVTKLTLVTFALFALCGDNMVKHWKASFFSALYVGMLLATTSNGKVTSKTLDDLPFADFSDLLSTSRLYVMVVFTISFQVLTVLDHGRQIQRWPLPVLLGSTFGYVVGSMLGLLLLNLQNRAKAKGT